MNQDNRPECKGEREEKLKPCPFCGSEKAMFDRNESRAQMGYYEIIVECQNCFAASGYCKTKKEALNQWNTRHTEQPEGWVSVEEEKPGYGELVLIYWLNIHGEPNISTGTLHSITRHCGKDSPHDDKWYMAYSISTNLNVTHWQTLPKPPEEE